MADRGGAANAGGAVAAGAASAGVAVAGAVLAAKVIARDERAVARLITQLEDGNPAAEDAMRELARLAPARAAGGAHVIGITGPPGSGKSTLADKLIAILRRRGERVGVLAVDPSSPFTGGAILGDRIRMNAHATDPGVFIRSLASRGRLGGLSRATGAAARVLGAAGYGYVIVETVGVGQSEVEVVKLADTVVLVSVPGLGDEIQVIKAGIMEIGDVFAVNKADRDGADRVVREIRAMLETARALCSRHLAPERMSADSLASGDHHRAGASPAAGGGAAGKSADGHGDWPELPPVLKTVAETGEGVEELLDAIIAHRERLALSGGLLARRLENARAELRGLVAFRLIDTLEGTEGQELEDRLARAVLEGSRDAFGAAAELFAAIGTRGKA